MNINVIKIKKEKALEEMAKLENNTYTLFDYSKYIQDIKRMEYLKGQISLYDDILVEAMSK